MGEVTDGQAVCSAPPFHCYRIQYCLHLWLRVLLTFFDDLIETFSDSHVRWTSMLFVSFSQTTTVKITLTNLLNF